MTDTRPRQEVHRRALTASRHPTMGRAGLWARIVATSREQRRRVTLSQRIALLTGVVVALAVLVTGGAAYASVRVTLYYQLDRQLVETASQAAFSVVTPEGELTQLSGTALRTASLIVEVTSADGSVYPAHESSEYLQIGPSEVAVAKLGSGMSARNGLTTTNEEYRIVAIPMSNLPDHAIVVGRPLDLTNWVLRSLLIILLSFGAVAAVLSGAIGAAVARQSLRPVRELTQAVEHVAATDDLTPITVIGNDELSRLALSFNTMLASLARSRDRQKQLIADAGHELRTPLTSLRTNIELLVADARRAAEEGQPSTLPPGARSEILTDVNAQLTEFTNLVRDLVQLARDDRVEAAPEPIDLSDVVQDAVRRVRLRGPHLGWDLELNSLYVIGEYDTLVRAVTNLLDNAVKWSPQGGTIRVQLEGDRLRIADQGHGIDDEDLPFIFDRFYRSDSSRNTPGTGLGLSIVAQTVARHAGWIRAGRSAQGGAEFTVHIPGRTTITQLSEEDPAVDVVDGE